MCMWTDAAEVEVESCRRIMKVHDIYIYIYIVYGQDRKSSRK